ncbi:unnamed protein product [Colias eurytheme]|nr:unnamed protein product [Colias eurytheme]
MTTDAMLGAAHNYPQDLYSYRFVTGFLRKSPLSFRSTPSRISPNAEFGRSFNRGAVSGRIPLKTHGGRTSGIEVLRVIFS